MKRIQLIFTLIGLAWGFSAYAQIGADPEERPRARGRVPNNSRYSSGSATVFYGVGFPTSSQQSYIDKMGTRNFALAIEADFPGHLSLGGRIGHQYTSDRLPRQVISLGDGSDVSAVQTRTLTLVPLMAIGSYHLTERNAPFRPYVQLGAGGAYVDYTTYYGSLADQKTGVRAAVAPAVGAKFLFGRNSNLGAEIQAQYQHVFFNYNELKNSGNVLVSVGLSYHWW
ncbi:outer membrane protein [Larkinella soli]|uniref:outer membrane protein n=1 Tax=Larkinella soli TaxID=1770527 RepID=UPI000FFCA527|nr:hypothetical protein [Larkinella soli]